MSARARTRQPSIMKGFTVRGQAPCLHQNDAPPVGFCEDPVERLPGLEGHDVLLAEVVGDDPVEAAAFGVPQHQPDGAEDEHRDAGHEDHSHVSSRSS
jgi:hypothetical protein